MNESQTPRTDALVDLLGNKRILPNDHNASGWSSIDTNAFIDFARNLERELVSANKERDEFHQALLNREKSLQRSGEAWVMAKADRDRWRQMADDLAKPLAIVSSTDSNNDILNADGLTMSFHKGSALHKEMISVLARYDQLKDPNDRPTNDG